MLQNKKRVAVVGYGGMGGFHTRHNIQSGVADVAGIWDINPTRRAVAEEKGIHVYKSLDDLLSDKSVDIVTIATPNELHKEIAIKAMEAGKNVVSEKPVAINSQELAEMIATSERTGKLFTVHQNRRWDCDFLMIKELYSSGKLGEVFGIESRVQGSRGIPGDWRAKKIHGGGMMLDWGVHLIDQILCIVNDKQLKSLYCKCDHITNNEVDDGFKLDLYFEKDLTVRIEVGTSHFISLPRFYMTGVNGSAIVNFWNSDCEAVYCENREDKDVVPVVTAAGLTKTMAPRDEKSISKHIIKPPVSDVDDFYRNVCLAIDGKEEQLITHKQMMRVMRVMEAAFESDRLGVPLAFKDN